MLADNSTVFCLRFRVCEFGTLISDVNVTVPLTLLYSRQNLTEIHPNYIRLVLISFKYYQFSLRSHPIRLCTQHI